jgi:hypothetical protein
MGNIMFDNGGAGIEAFAWLNASTARATIVNNTVYGNYWDLHNNATWRGDFNLNDAYNVAFINNIAYSVVGAGLLSHDTPFVGNGTTGTTNNSWQNNISYPGGATNFGGNNTYPTSGTNHNGDGIDPAFSSVTPGGASNNFALGAGSPAVGFGQAFDLWQQTGAVDVGAGVHTLTSCP